MIDGYKRDGTHCRYLDRNDWTNQKKKLFALFGRPIKCVPMDGFLSTKRWQHIDWIEWRQLWSAALRLTADWPNQKGTKFNWICIESVTEKFFNTKFCIIINEMYRRQFQYENFCLAAIAVADAVIMNHVTSTFLHLFFYLCRTVFFFVRSFFLLLF